MVVVLSCGDKEETRGDGQLESDVVNIQTKHKFNLPMKILRELLNSRSSLTTVTRVSSESYL